MEAVAAILSASDAPQPTSTSALDSGPATGVGTVTETTRMETQSRFSTGSASASAPGSAPGSAPAPALPVPKQKRRFVPQLIERTVKSSSDRRHHLVSPPISEKDVDTKPDTRTDGSLTSGTSRPLSLMPPSSTSNANQNQTTRDRDISLRPRESGMSTSHQHAKTIRRFAPIPIETTFDSYRVANKNPRGPAPEPTPDPSPTSSQSSVSFLSTAAPMTPEPAQTAQKEKPNRRFAPQLIETTRSSRRAGQEGPAMKPTDKTDITPGTNHIYVLKPRPNRPNNSSAGPSNTNAENGTASPRLLATLRERRLNGQSNSTRSTRQSSYHPGLDTIPSSESEDSSEDEDGEADPALNSGPAALCDTQSNPADTWGTRGYDLRYRRESCDEEFSGYFLGIAAREAHRQREFEQALSAFPNGLPPQGVEHFLARDNSEDDLQIGDDESPLRHGPSQLLRRKSTDPGWAVKEMRAHAEKLSRMRGDAHTGLDRNMVLSDVTPPPDDPHWTTTAANCESRDSAIERSTDSLLSPSLPVLSSRLPPGHDILTPPPSTGVRTGPFGTGLAVRGGEPEDGMLGKMRKAASPPMLGADLEFRTCPSPQYTRMEPNHPYSHFDQIEERQRDRSGATGLWRGYCSSNTGNLDPPSLQPPDLLRTPSVCTNIDPFASAFEASANLNEMLSPAYASGAERANFRMQNPSETDEISESERESAEREEAFLAEFDDQFVTQVYNYLSLGYPATAYAFDDELSKISGVPMEELRRYDNVKVGKGFMRNMAMSVSFSSTDSCNDDNSSGDDESAPPPLFEYEKTLRRKNPRWTALKLYIHEWARQHPSLNEDDDSGPPAWGVRARRGSWAV